MNKKLFVAIIAGFFALTNVNAQSLKVGYTNINFLVSNHPDSKEIETKLKTEEAQYNKMLQEKVADFQKKLGDYEKGASAMTDVIRADKEKQLQNQQAEIQEFQQNMQSSLQKKQQVLLAPLLEKIQKAITDVAKENAYTYVFNSDAGMGTDPVLLHAPDNDNITNLVFKKMGVVLPTAAPAVAPK